jgi:succinate dehydrogenase flavin-adding protein (antitoxin of CptAB toxin-antitoxin module)
VSPFEKPPGTTIYCQVDVDVLPTRIERRGSKILGGLAMSFALAFTSLPAIALAKAVAVGEWNQDVLLGLAWFAIPLPLFVALFLWGYNQWVEVSTVELDGREVRWYWRTWRGTREKTETLAAFGGIRAKTRRRSGDGQIWELLLEHPDPALTVLLYQANRPAGVEERQQRYGEVFHAPPLGGLES